MRVIGRVDGVGRIGEKERIAVGRRADHVFGGDIVGGAGPVLDQELGAEAPRQPIADQTGDDVDGAAAGKADEDFHRPVRIVERRGAARKSGKRGGAGGQAQEFATGKVHDVAPRA